MASNSILQNFYKSDAWRNFRLQLIAERGLRCEHCGGRVQRSEDLTLHHIKELTADNVSDVMISLNPENIQIVHHNCHTRIHQRTGSEYRKQQVRIVYGPPLSGKTSYVRERMEYGDLVVDMDLLYESLSMLPRYNKPDKLLPNVFAVQNVLLDNIKTRYGKWRTAWVIGGYADRHKREKLAADLGAELVFMDIAKEECLARLEADQQRKRWAADWRGYIEKWFQDYRP